MLAARGNEGRRNTVEMFIKRNVAAGYFHISIWKIFWGGTRNFKAYKWGKGRVSGRGDI